MTSKIDENNATYLFQGRKRELRHSESFWSSLAALTILGSCAEKSEFRLPRYRFIAEGESWEYQLDAGELIIRSPLTWADVTVESCIFPSKSDVPKELCSIRPDIYIRQQMCEKLIEVKTIGATLCRDQLGLYVQICEKLKQENKDKEVELYCLLSHGHECPGDLNKIKELQKEGKPLWIILWEDMLEYIDKQIPYFSRLFASSFCIADFYREKELKGKSK
jgi:hypothetical protein